MGEMLFVQQEEYFSAPDFAGLFCASLLAAFSSWLSSGTLCAVSLLVLRSHPVASSDIPSIRI